MGGGMRWDRAGTDGWARLSRWDRNRRVGPPGSMGHRRVSNLVRCRLIEIEERLETDLRRRRCMRVVGRLQASSLGGRRPRCGVEEGVHLRGVRGPHSEGGAVTSESDGTNRAARAEFAHWRH